MNFRELYETIIGSENYPMMTFNPLAQFASEQGTMLGAQLLPEILQDSNEYTETDLKWKVRPALDNNRYSPTQLQSGGQVTTGFKVELADTDTKNEMTSKMYDDLMILLSRGGDMQAIARAIAWIDNVLLRPHQIKNEINRWQALLLGEVARRSANQVLEPITYSRADNQVLTVPSGTVGAPAGWHDITYPLLDDVRTAVQTLEDYGHRATGIYTSPKVTRLMKQNEQVIARGGGTVIRNGALENTDRRLVDGLLDRIFLDDEFPAVTPYNLGYESIEGGYKRYFDVEPETDTEAGADYVLVTGTTNRDYSTAIDYVGTTGIAVSGAQDDAVQVGNTLGYYGIGRNAGESSSGRTLTTWVNEKKPKGLAGEAYQTGLPVIQELQSYIVIRLPRPTS